VPGRRGPRRADHQSGRLRDRSRGPPRAGRRRAPHATYRLGCQAIAVSPTAASTAGDRTRVLVVDDELNITELVSMGLRYEGFDVSSAHDGHGALRAIREFTPELVILDVTMPDLD